MPVEKRMGTDHTHGGFPKFKALGDRMAAGVSSLLITFEFPHDLTDASAETAPFLIVYVRHTLFYRRDFGRA